MVNSYVSLALTGALILGYFAERFFSRKVRRIVNRIPGPKPLPVLGNALVIAKHMHERAKVLLDRMFTEHGGIYRVWMFNRPYIVIGSAKYVEGILTNSRQIDKGRDYEAMKEWLGDGLIMSKGKKWMERRKIITPAFHLRTLDSLVPIFVQHADVFVKVLRHKADTDEVFDVFPMACRCTLDIICDYAMGVKLNAQMDTQSQYVSSINRICKTMVDSQIHPIKRIRPIFRLTKEYRQLKKDIRFVHDFNVDVIRRRRAVLDEIKEEDRDYLQDDRTPFLDRLIFAKVNGKGLTDIGIKEEVDTFMFGGHDTTSTNLSFLLHFLGNNKQIQDKVFEEIINVIGEDDGEVTVDQLHDLKYLECCIKEALRLVPSVPAVFRGLTEDVQAGEYMLPAGTDIVISFIGIQRDPAQFPDPLKFRPERFMNKESELRSNFAFIPFSAGRRNCIGQKFAMLEEKVIISKIIRHFEVESAEAFEDIELMAEVVLKAKKGVQIRLRRRAPAPA